MSEIELDLTNLKNSIDKLKESIEAYNNLTDETLRSFIEDSCVKRFEFTGETSWKMMKKFLKLQYGKEDKELTMNNIFRFMEGYGIIKSWEMWRGFYDRRNDTSHEYNNEKSKKILGIIEDFWQEVNEFYNNLKQAIGE